MANKLLEAFQGNREMLLHIINNPPEVAESPEHDKDFTYALVSLCAHNEFMTLRHEEKKELLQKIDKPANISELEKRLHEAYDYLKIPVAKEEEIVDRMIEHKPVLCQQNLDSRVEQFYVFAKMSRNPKPMLETYEHSARTALYSILISEFLGFNDEYKLKHFCAALWHDIGKFAVFNRAEGKSFEELRPKMRVHPITGESFNFLGNDIGDMIKYHHFHQEDKYPEKLEGDESKESVYVSKLLAINDWHDSGSTRKNGKFLELKDKLLLRNLPTREKVRKMLLYEYGNLDLTYEGILLPFSFKKGSVLLNDLYEKGIFGKKNALNPFPDKESFKYVKQNGR